MTFKELKERIEKYNIPDDVRLMSDSGWECGATEMDGIYYGKEENIIIFKQEFEEDSLYCIANNLIEIR